MGRIGGLWGKIEFGFLLFLSFSLIIVPGALAWSKEGHMMTCKIAQVRFNFPHLFFHFFMSKNKILFYFKMNFLKIIIFGLKLKIIILFYLLFWFSITFTIIKFIKFIKNFIKNI